MAKKLLFNKNFHAFVFSEAESTLHNLGDIFPTFDWWVFIWAIKTWNLCFPVRVIKERHRTSWSASLEFFFWYDDSVNLSPDKLVSDFIGFSCRIICTWLLQSWYIGSFKTVSQCVQFLCQLPETFFVFYLFQTAGFYPFFENGYACPGGRG